jgi:hypothetical protein
MIEVGSVAERLRASPVSQVEIWMLSPDRLYTSLSKSSLASPYVTGSQQA